MELNLKEIFKLALIGVLIYIGVMFAQPYWNKYWLDKELKDVAMVGTLDGATDESIRAKLDEVMTEQGRPFKSNQFAVIRDSQTGTTTIEIQYEEVVNIFTYPVTKFPFIVSVTEKKSGKKYF